MATRIISALALAATITPCLLYLTGIIGHEAVKAATLVGTVAWFIATPLWMGRDLPIDSKEVEI
jgi:hypothetical protein